MRLLILALLVFGLFSTQSYALDKRLYVEQLGKKAKALVDFKELGQKTSDGSQKPIALDDYQQRILNDPNLSDRARTLAIINQYYKSQASSPNLNLTNEGVKGKSK